MIRDPASCLAALGLAKGYSTSDDDLLEDFYAPALSRASSYDRAVGYFSSGLIALAPLAFASFVERGGRLRLVCSPHLSALDARRLDVADEVPGTREEIVQRIKVLSQADDLSAALTQVMSSLLASGTLTVKFARHSGSGLFHDKIGLFADECGHDISFVGSANETAAAWSGYINHEQIETFSAWQSLEQEERVRRHRRQFDEIWFNLARGLTVEPAETSAALIYDVSAPESPEVSLGRLKRLITERRASRSDQSAAKPRELRDHQAAVLESWRAAERRGIVAFATGGGKTLTAIQAVREWTQADRPAPVLVPSSLLHRQWSEELEAELPEIPRLAAGAGNRRSDWVTNLSAASDPDPTFGPRIILATYATATSADFLRRIQGGPHLLLVADEVHRMGAPDARRLFELDAGGRLALSATPERYGDAEGTAAIFDYFGSILEPRFGIRQAIEAEQLVPYDYFLETVALTEEEMELWDKLSADIAKEIARNDGARTERALYLTRERAKVIKSASAKAPKAAEILEERFRLGDRWLVYCDSLAHLRSVRHAVEVNGRPVFEYHSGNSRLGQEIFQHFERGGVLLAIKCLDEGVDLPFVNRALILASTSNPREYIQRRGRVLRRAADKYFAQVVDVAVTDDDGGLLSLTEGRRALEFAQDAANRAGLLRLQVLQRKSETTSRWRRDDTATETDMLLGEAEDE